VDNRENKFFVHGGNIYGFLLSARYFDK